MASCLIKWGNYPQQSGAIVEDQMQELSHLRYFLNGI